MMFPPSRRRTYTLSMPQIISLGSELLRINPQKNSIEVSKDGGKNWSIRKASSSSHGTFMDLVLFGQMVYAVTSKGVYFSKDKGSNWSLKRANTSSSGNFQSIMQDGTNLLAQTSKGLYYSKDGGANWTRK